MKIKQLLEFQDHLAAHDLGHLAELIFHTIKKDDDDLTVEKIEKIILNPIVLGLLSSYAEHTIKKYIHRKEYVTHFLATSPSERTFYEKIVAELMGTGHYKNLIRKESKHGDVWELERKD